MKKKVDPRIRQMLQDAVKNNHRALLLLVGDKSRDQVVNLHYMLSKMLVTSRPSVLWCYKKELGFSASKKKRMKVMKKRMKQGLVDANKDDPFELFISSTTIRFAYYHESHKILGNTYGMCVLQDFEALTPNLLARTLETVQGAGLVVILVHSMPSLRRLFSLAMDAHARLRTEAHASVVPRFNERFILSLADCPAAIVADDELNVLPISSHMRALPGNVESAPGVPGKSTADAPELSTLKKSLEDTHPIGPLVAHARTVDQATAVLRFEEALSEKTLRTTVALTASRGRGKSAALGLAVAAAIAHEYSNIFVTSPSPENLRTFFAFVLVGFDALGLIEHADYEIVQTQGGDHSADTITRLNVFKSHRQTVQYVDPTDASRFLSQAELLVIDEAAAIPLPLVESMLGPYVVFMSSTVTGYEGTGRSLSLKLLKKLRDGGNTTGAPNAIAKSKGLTLTGGEDNDLALRQAEREAKRVAAHGGGTGRTLQEVHMETPIRYSEKDPVEAWLYDLLCLRAGGTRQVLTGGAPHPRNCELYYVERDALFSRHAASEAFLQRVVALFVSSHYKNSPNDLQMLSDAPAHALFVLLAPTRSDATALPDVLVAIQVCLEGRISHRSSSNGLATGARAHGDLIPWTVSQQFQEPEFATLAGARIVRVATHPDLHGMGYGTRAVQLLMDYYSGKIISLDNVDDEGKNNDKTSMGEEENSQDEEDGNDLLNEIIGPRKNIPPLLRRLHEHKPQLLDYIGVSFGLTDSLYNFWAGKLGFQPLYVRLTPNELTGEHTCIMANCAVSASGNRTEKYESFSTSWLGRFHEDFRRRLVQLLGYELRKFSPKLAVAMLEQRPTGNKAGDGATIGVENDMAVITKSDATPKETDMSVPAHKSFHAYDLRRLESYARSLVDFHLIMDLLPRLAEMLVLGAFDRSATGDGAGMGLEEGISVSLAQRAILIGIGLQRKSVDITARELGVQVNQVLALLNKAIRKLARVLRTSQQVEAEAEVGKGKFHAEAVMKRLPGAPSGNDAVHDDGDDSDHKDEDHDDNAKTKESTERKVSGPLENYTITGSDKDWAQALSGKRNGDVPAVVSIKAARLEGKRKADGDKDGGPNKAKDNSGKKRKKKKFAHGAQQ